MSGLFAWPEAARVDRRIPRDQLFRRAGGGKTVRALYEAQVERIDWAWKLFERSVNLPPAGGVTEIQVIRVALRAGALDDRVLIHIDKALPRQTWFELVRVTPDGAEVQAAAAFKRVSEADSSKVVTHEHWRGAWAPDASPRASLPVATTLEGLYAGMLRALWPHPARKGESLRSQADRLSEAAAQAKAVERLAAAVRRESDFARQVEKNRELRAAQARLKELTDPSL
jgi:hypothetical protein